MKIRVLIVDDSILYRKIIQDILAELPDVEVVGSVSNGQMALSRIRLLNPDLLTLDVEMPVMDGIQTLEALQKQKLDLGCIMVSSKTQRGSEATIKALELGAFDFIEKPDEKTTEANITLLKQSLDSVIKAFSQRQRIRQNLYGRAPVRPVSRSPALPPQPVRDLPQPTLAVKRAVKSNAVAIGISTGGPNALMQLLPGFPGDINIPIFLVQHMPPVFSASLARSLDKKCALHVKEAEDGEAVQPNTVYVAMGGKQMKITSGTGLQKIIRITDDDPENNCKPSVDYLLRSVAREYGSKSTCVIMTGMGADGKLGISVTRASGAFTIAQNEETCVVYGMPKAIVDAGLADVVAPLHRIADEVLKTIR
ncbi:chemotaxis response regulator protein-glutamate methylesterase [bacterium]|nr:chemotaxis response regulator protein-glutamate methylesterase [bacterium]